MLKAILTACALVTWLAFATSAEARLETTIDNTPAPILRSVVLSFTAPVDAERSKIRVFDAFGREIATDGLQTNDEGTELVAPISSPLVPGSYKVFWESISRAGRDVSGISELTVPFEGTSATTQAFAP
ncbi:copper resistance protein CopC [Rhizobiaceae bacterium n13]|uniref:Copper resistance protein CopC n=1 Tax=Ferirhizobium litorale TaxID=2927786 RepID=A0AAE3U403_9HYPH|nr:copper resistance protein CopC [Fererhizobium litorale]MDI7864221.1 copper resistance protein CopC [Fererhizobium litorale]MDI7925136.1 copper resistance protein CopC [Fererhizobium litorale]